MNRKLDIWLNRHIRVKIFPLHEVKPNDILGTSYVPWEVSGVTPDTDPWESPEHCWIIPRNQKEIKIKRTRSIPF